MTSDAIESSGQKHSRRSSRRGGSRKRRLFRTGAVLGILLFTAVLVWALTARKMPDLEIWHTTLLSAEFTARDATARNTLQGYLDLEKRLFQELKDKIYDHGEPSDTTIFSRYRAGGSQDPGIWETNWNRTFELVPQRITGGALLLHGLTDSPYSLRQIGEMLYAKGFYVLGLRLPAHGTIPGALTTVRWEDWVAASRLGARHVRKRIGPDRPFMIAGYSNGGALAVMYALDALIEPDLPSPDRLLLFSPEIGISPLARLAGLHKLLSFLPYFAKSKWESIEPEYDPFKYNSFPMNAARQAHKITTVLQDRMEAVHKAGKLADFPTVLTFLSWVDATVDTPATLERLYGRLENEGSEIVVFDVNRSSQLTAFLPAARREALVALEARSTLPYRLTILTNLARDSHRLARRTKAPRSSAIESAALDLAWPPGLYSLTHVAVPFSPSDPVYGADQNTDHLYQGLRLGRLKPRGETHLLTVSLSQLMRLRYNPFFGYLAQRVDLEIDHTIRGKEAGNN